MAAVQSNAQKTINRAAVGLVVLVTLVYLVPIYWITTTAFKPRSLATTVPPTVLFTPEVTAFIKLFTKRVQMISKVDPDVYAKAPWWEQRIYDLGERFIKDSDGHIELSAYPSRFLNSMIVAVVSTFLAVAMGTLTAYGFSRFRLPGELQPADHPVQAITGKELTEENVLRDLSPERLRQAREEAEP